VVCKKFAPEKTTTVTVALRYELERIASDRG
jgi:hypothetical protein